MPMSPAFVAVTSGRWIMRNYRNFVAFALTAIAVSHCDAENRFCLGGETDHLTVAERKSCAEQMQVARTLVARYSHVDNWHFVLVCGESNWAEYSEFSRNDPKALLRVVADTTLNDRTTYLRGDMLTTKDASLIDSRMLTSLTELGSDRVASVEPSR